MRRAWTILGFCILAMTAAMSSALGVEIIGPARVIDGDTIEISGTRIRLHGIDAPEGGQTCERGGQTYDCGQEATWALAERVGRHWLTCVQRDVDRYKRIVATCYLGGIKGIDVNAHMVAQGWALAFRTYSTVYVTQEADAQRARRGMWAGQFEAPWDWRKAKGSGRPGDE